MLERLTVEWERWQGLLVTNGVRILFILVIAIAAYRVMKFFTKRLRNSVRTVEGIARIEAEKRAQTLGSIVEQISMVAIIVIAGMLTMKEMGFDIGPLIASAGIAGIAIGFGAQNLVRDIITGFFILFENQIRVGDVVEVAGKTGLVEEVNLRTIILRDAEGSVHTIPNGAISVVTNRTREWSRIVVDVGVAYKENVDRVMDVLREVGAEMEGDTDWTGKILEPLTILGVNNFGASSVDIRVFFKTAPQKQWEVGRELRRRIKNRFDAEGIEIPFPHVTVYMGEGVQGTVLHKLAGQKHAPPAEQA